MSASDTEIDRQRRHHAVPIGGIVLAALFGLLMAAAVLFAAFDGDEEEGPQALPQAAEAERL